MRNVQRERLIQDAPSSPEQESDATEVNGGMLMEKLGAVRCCVFYFFRDGDRERAKDGGRGTIIIIMIIIKKKKRIKSVLECANVCVK